MDIEDLSKSQLLLLTILVNFVVSIATGVLTVSLLAAVPTTVTQTVNKIVDHTIETIATPIQVVTNPTPTQSNEEPLTVAVSADVARTVLIYKTSTTSPALAYGVYLPVSKAIATVSSGALPQNVLVQFSNGETAEASLSKASGSLSIFGFADNETLPKAPAAVLPSADTLKQGQTIVGINKDSAALTGIVSKVDEAGIHSTLSDIPPGAAIVNLSGAVVGLAGLTPNLFISADRILLLLQASSTSSGT